MDLFLHKNWLATVVIKLLLIFSFSVTAQTNNFLIYLTDKSNSLYSTEKPEEFLSSRSVSRRLKQNIEISEGDFPVNTNYIQEIEAKGVHVQQTSKWFNALLIAATQQQLDEVMQLPFVKTSLNLDKTLASGNEFVNLHQSIQCAEVLEDYGDSFGQTSMLGIDKMHEEGINGEGVLIAVFDAGFASVNYLSGFEHLFANNQIIKTYDFYDQEEDVYDDHFHGTPVLSVIGAYLPDQVIGGAFKADFILLRTENINYEKQLEEFYWLVGAEYADSAGADIISSSLGYNIFDTDNISHTYNQLNGKTTIISAGAEIAFSKGILVINSAGNEGSSQWKYLLSPADGENVLTVGGVRSDRSYYNLSSVGPTSDGRIKPDVAALGENVTVISTSGMTRLSGTSFAAPIVTGFAANLWQKYPDLTNVELLELIRRSGSQSENPDNFIGYGIPGYERAKSFQVGITSKKGVKRVFQIHPNPTADYFKISSTGLVINEISIVDISGQEVFKQKLTKDNDTIIYVSNFPAGFYQVVVTGNDSSEIHSLVILK